MFLARMDVKRPAHTLAAVVVEIIAVPHVAEAVKGDVRRHAQVHARGVVLVPQRGTVVPAKENVSTHAQEDASKLVLGVVPEVVLHHVLNSVQQDAKERVILDAKGHVRLRA